jgi:hypothetical protein
MNGHLRRCRCASGPHAHNSALRSGARGALHLTIPEQAQMPDDSDGFLAYHDGETGCQVARRRLQADA